MQLLDHLRALKTREAQEAFAARVGSSIGHLRNVAYGYKPCATDLAVAIEADTKGAVQRRTLRPNDYWRHWPDLKPPRVQRASKATA
jgi:DNA-binding transcriptional regulator YdaS (Cro superfamily)